mgnify:FL=1
MIYKSFDIVVVPFPFTNKSSEKRRPVVVLSSLSPHHTILSMITSTHLEPWKSDINIERWQEAGLTTSSRIRFKIFTLDQTLILKTLGKLHTQNQSKLRQTLKDIFPIDVTP